MSTTLATLWYWTPSLALGFLMNIIISIGAMVLGTAIGMAVGLGRISTRAWVRQWCWGLTQFLRNTPSLVLLFYLAYLLPYEIHLGSGYVLPIPGWFKAVIGLSMPVIGFMSDNVYGAVRNIHTDQWDAAEALPLSRYQTMTSIILPQATPMLLPPWMSYFAVIVMASSTASMVGVKEILSSATIAMESITDPGLVIPMYFYVLCWFFLFCYPFSHITRWFERRKWQ